jgi:hypothetical protein
METEGQWCDNAYCSACGKIGADNIKMRPCTCTLRINITDSPTDLYRGKKV